MGKKVNGGGQEWVLQVADLGFKICKKWPKICLFGGSLGAQAVHGEVDLHWNQPR